MSTLSRGLLVFVFVFLSACSTPRPPGGGLSESELIVVSAAVRSGAALGVDRIESQGDAFVVADACRAAGDVLDGGDFTSGVDVLQERLDLSEGEARAILNLLMTLRALIPNDAFESQYVSIFQGGLEECVLVLEAKFPEIRESFGEKVFNWVLPQ